MTKQKCWLKAAVWCALQEAIKKLFHPLVLMQRLLAQYVVDLTGRLASQPLIDVAQHLTK